MIKKEERLSPKARKLLEVARGRFSTEPKKAVDYLMSVDSKELTLYDRQKIGREILRRYNKSNPHEFNSESESVGETFIQGIKREYQIDRYPHPQKPSKKYRHSKEYYQHEKRQKEGTEGRIQRMNRLKHQEEHSFNLGKMFESKGEFAHAEFSYLMAAGMYITTEKYDKAVECYNLALSALEKSDVKQKEVIKRDFENHFKLIRKLEELKKERDKEQGLEKTVATTTIVSIILGIFFLSNNITGNVIGNITNSTSNFIGAGLLIIGLVAGFFWVKRR